MANQKLLALKGLPASGKSTKAKLLVEDEGYFRTNKDTIRKEMFGDDYKRKDEKKVVKERDRLVRKALSEGKNVVVDDTNLNPVHIKDLLNIAKEFNVDFEVDDSFLQVPIAECIERDKNREESVGEQTIRQMFHDFVKTPSTALKYDPSLPMAVICDIDGTLAHMNGKRSPYDYKKVQGDEVDAAVAHVLDGISLIGYAKVIIFSGRDEVCRPETEEWLERNDIEYDALYMRRSNHFNVEGDEKSGQVPDTIVKAEMLEKYIVGQYNVLCVIDDRPVVCRMWRDVYGLRVMQVGDPYYEF